MDSSQPMQEKEPTMLDNHQIPSSLNQQRAWLDAFESQDHRQQEQLGQQQLRPIESSIEERRKPIDTHDYEIGGKDEHENTEKKSDGRNTKRDKRNENGGVLGAIERLKRHRTEVAGQVWIPEMWGQEDFLKDWIDCTAFESSLVPQNIMLARASLMEEGRRSNSNTIRVENSC